MRQKYFQPQRGCILPAANRCNPFRVDDSSDRFPRVIAPLQPWAEGWNPFRILPIPPLAEQRALVAELETERALVEANQELRQVASRLVVRFAQRLQTKLAKIWGAPPAEPA
ncbi:MAG: hypothetical protein MUF81_03640 [Verrucomicrobia bacterium]|nr:hypothetical protein [Verrucomicrobiota bacterium]